MQGFFTRQVKPFVFQQSSFDFFHGAAHGRFAHLETAGGRPLGQLELAAILTPVAQGQQKLVGHTQSGAATATAARCRHHLHHQLKHTTLDAGQAIKLLLAIFAHFDQSHSKKLNRIMQEV